MKVAALIPAADEAKTIGLVVAGLMSLASAIVVVDDGSTDGTAARAQEAGATVLRHTKNLGKGTAIRTGLARILSSDFTHVLLLDGDMQHLPSEAPSLLHAAETSGADVVIGERMFRRSDMPASRYHANRIGSWALSSFMGVPIRDTQCGYRVFQTGVLRPLTLHARGYEIETEMLVKVVRRGGRVATVPVSAVYTGQPSKLRPVRDTTRTCFLAVYYRYIERV